MTNALTLAMTGIQKFKKTIERCDVAVLLISADFLTSPFILDQEVPQLLQRRQEQGIRVIPLIVRPL